MIGSARVRQWTEAGRLVVTVDALTCALSLRGELGITEINQHCFRWGAPRR